MLPVKIMEKRSSCFFTSEIEYIIWATKFDSPDIPVTFWNTQWLIRKGQRVGYVEQRWNYFSWLARQSRQWFTTCCTSATSNSHTELFVSLPLLFLCLSEVGKRLGKWQRWKKAHLPSLVWCVSGSSSVFGVGQRWLNAHFIQFMSHPFTVKVYTHIFLRFHNGNVQCTLLIYLINYSTVASCEPVLFLWSWGWIYMKHEQFRQ